MASSFQCLLFRSWYYRISFFFLPKKTIEKRDKQKKKLKIPLAVYGFSLGMGGIMLAYYSIATNMALFLEQNDIGGPALAGTIISFTTVGGMITSLLLAWLETKFKNQLIPIMLLGMGIAFTLLSFTNNIALVVVSVCLIGFGQGILFPLIIL